MSIFKKMTELASCKVPDLVPAKTSDVNLATGKKVKHYFVINPVAGKGLKSNFAKDIVEPACRAKGVDYEIYFTKAPGDGIQFVRETAANGEPARFYACGGDGTLYEVVNGAYGYKNAQVAVVPLGSGNDWTRLFGDFDMYLDIESQIDGTPIQIDCIKAGDEIAINQASMGFDADACAVQGQMKKLPGVAGHLSYFLGGLYCMFTKVKNDYDVTLDGKKIDGPFIFVVGANSRWYGSGIQVAPFAMVDDHMLDVVAMKRKTPWIVMFKVMMFDWQNNATHVHHRDCEYLRGKKLVIHDNKMKNNHTNIDGECHRTNDIVIELIENGLTFNIPKNSPYFDDVKSGKINGDIVVDEKKFRLIRGII